MSVTAFQRRRRELAKNDEEIVMVPVAGDMTVMERETAPSDHGTTHENQHPEIQATAAAEKLAAERGINLRQLTGTGADGQIVLGDVRKAAAPTESVE